MSKAQDYLYNYGPFALVTGASSGIGRAFADELAGRGFNLVLVARRGDLLAQIAGDLTAAHGIEVVTIQQDLAETDAADHILDQTAPLDIGLVVSNAGFSMKGEHAANDPAEMTRMLMVNCHAPMQLTREFVPRLRQRSRGGIILTSSVEGLIGCPFSGVYSASKAFVKALGEALWAELRPDNIDVLTLCPGATDTEGLARSGYDAAKIPHVMPASDVAVQALDRIDQGPMFVSSDHHRNMFEKLVAMPRGEALTLMASSMKPAEPA